MNHSEIEDQVYEIALTLVPGIGDYLTKTLVAYCGSAKAVFNTSHSKLLKVPGIGKGITQAIDLNSVLDRAQKEWENLKKLGYKSLFFTDSEYPFLLKQANDAPAILYLAGNASLSAEKSIAIVGTRKASHYGKEMAAAIVEGLKVFQPTIISGLAFGIDIAAHKAALEAGIPTIGVMASGLDVVYPKEHKAVSKEIQQGGLLVSENLLGTQPEAPFFVARNRIIAGLSQLTIVVESAIRGGGLITAEIALSYDREVMAVPGNIGNKYSEGCNKLILLNKASIYTCTDDIVNLLGWEKEEGNKKSKTRKTQNINSFSTENQQIIKSLFLEKEVQIDDLAWKSGLGINLCASVLLNLEFEGMVKALPGKKFRWIGPDIIQD